MEIGRKDNNTAGILDAMAAFKKEGLGKDTKSKKDKEKDTL